MNNPETQISSEIAPEVFALASRLYAQKNQDYSLAIANASRGRGADRAGICVTGRARDSGEANTSCCAAKKAQADFGKCRGGDGALGNLDLQHSFFLMQPKK